MDEIAILHLEDNAMDAELLQGMLETEGFRIDLKRVDLESEFVNALQTWKPDLIISDFSLPSYNGKIALAVAKSLCPRTPFIFFSGTIGEESAIDALKLGATDYVLKQRPQRLISAIRRALAEAELQAEKAEAELKIKSQAQLIELAREAIITQDMEDRVMFWNEGAERMYGFTRSEAVGKKITNLIAQFSGSQLEVAKERTRTTGYWEGEFEHTTKENGVIQVSSHWTLVSGEAGQPDHILSISTDVTEKKQLEKQFLRAQRLESIGTLASGIAHDLNNILAPIFMATEILQEETLTPGGKAMLQTIQQSAQRGADIVKQVLTFVRGTEGKRTSLMLGYIIDEVRKVASETFPRNIQVSYSVDRDLWLVNGDATQLHQVLMNLCVNARDAMPQGGQLRLSAKNTTDELGPRVLITVEDTGTGIPSEIMEKVFDPFFTTKELGKGTGLGLSTVLGIVKSHGGILNVDSKEGVGTSFQISLPVDQTSQRSETVVQRTPVRKGNGELILLVDDEAEIRRTTAQALIQNGYDVLTAHDGHSALAQFTTSKDKIRLVVSDIMMPGVNGASLLEGIKTINPLVSIIVTSGIAERAELPGVSRTLQKPFHGEVLLRAVDEVING